MEKTEPKVIKIDNKCGNCRSYRKGRCFNGPPTPSLFGLLSYYPRVSKTGICAQWDPNAELSTELQKQVDEIMQSNSYEKILKGIKDDDNFNA